MVKMLEKAQKVLLLEDFTPLTIEYGCKSPNAHAECVLQYPYKSITVRYGKDLLDDWCASKRDEVKAVLIHEMCHPITDPLYCKASERWVGRNEIEDERERLTDHIANIIIKQNLV